MIFEWLFWLHPGDPMIGNCCKLLHLSFLGTWHRLWCSESTSWNSVHIFWVQWLWHKSMFTFLMWPLSLPSIGLLWVIINRLVSSSYPINKDYITTASALQFHIYWILDAIANLCFVNLIRKNEEGSVVNLVKTDSFLFALQFLKIIIWQYHSCSLDLKHK